MEFRYRVSRKVGENKTGFHKEAGRVLKRGKTELDVAENVREDVRDRRPQEGEDHDNHNRHQHEDEGVFDEALAFVIFESKHGGIPFG